MVVEADGVGDPEAVTPGMLQPHQPCAGMGNAIATTDDPNCCDLHDELPLLGKGL